MSAAGPPQGAKAPVGGSEPHEVGERGGNMSAAGPPQGANAPVGGSAVPAATSPGPCLDTGTGRKGALYV